MGESKDMSGPNPNMEPLGPRANGSSDNSNLHQKEKDSQCTPRSRLQSRGRRNSTPDRPRFRSSLQHRRQDPSVSSQKESRSRIYRSRSPPHSHRMAPRDRGVQNSDYYRPSYSYSTKHRSPRSQSPPHRRRDTPGHRRVSTSNHHRSSYQARGGSRSLESNVSTPPSRSLHNSEESLHDEEALATVSWAELVELKYKELNPPTLNPPDMPIPIEESWAEMASRKHKEMMESESLVSAVLLIPTSVEQSCTIEKSTFREQETEVVKATVVDPETETKSPVNERKRLPLFEGLDLQQQLRSRMYSRNLMAAPTLPMESKVGITMDAKKENNVYSTLVGVSTQDLTIFSVEPMPDQVKEVQSSSETIIAASKQPMKPPGQSFPSPPSTLSGPLPSVSPSKVRINKEKLQAKIIEIRRASTANEQPRPIPNIMDDAIFGNNVSGSDFDTVEPAIPTHWED